VPCFKLRTNIGSVTQMERWLCYTLFLRAIHAIDFDVVVSLPGVHFDSRNSRSIFERKSPITQIALRGSPCGLSPACYVKINYWS
jgi:hypothetical protein